jgi:glycosyltransferase involved in cell wall biosynthesis
MKNETPATSPGSPLISIITVVFNGGAVIEKTIQSVSTQTFSDREYIVVDGGSKDNTTDIIKRHSRVIDTWRSEPDKGIYDAMNKGISMAKGRWLIFMNAGDTFFEATTLEKFAGSLPYLDRADMVFGDAYMTSPDGNEGVRTLSDSNVFLIRNMICHQCIFYSSQLFQKVGAFDTSYRLTADFEHLTRIKWSELNIIKIPYVISRYSLDGVSATKEGIVKIWKERIRIFEDNKRVPWLIRVTFSFYAKMALRYRGVKK